MAGGDCCLLLIGLLGGYSLFWLLCCMDDVCLVNSVGIGFLLV